MMPGKSFALDRLMHHVAGDYWEGVSSIAITVDGSPPATAVSSCRINFRTSVDAASAAATLTNANGKITIVSAANWTFAIPEQNLGLTAGDYVWSFEVTDASNVVRTYLQGNMTVHGDITHS